MATQNGLNNIRPTLAPGGGYVWDEQTALQMTRALNALQALAQAAQNTANAAQATATAAGSTQQAQAATPGSNIQSIGTANAAGSDTTQFAPDNHVHQGLLSLHFNADAFGAITLAGELVSQSGNTFTISGVNGIVLGIATYTDPISNVTPTGFTNILLSNAHSVSFALPPAASNPGRIFSLNARSNVAVPVVAANGTDTVESNTGRGNCFYQSGGSNNTWYCIMSINSP